MVGASGGEGANPTNAGTPGINIHAAKNTPRR